MPQEPILLDTLTERELEIIPLLEEGLSNKEIANQLFLAPNTVKWYITQLNSKLDTSNRHKIVERASELGLLDAQAEQKSYLRPRQNLPRQTTPFVGRDAELDEIHQIIEKDEVRLLTILAQGGMGKTRIALEASEQQLNRFPDGVYFVALQALSDVNNIVPQIATSTGFQFSNDGRSQKEQLLDFLAYKTMLLCIDNWEHLLDGVDLLNEILQSAPDVKILATSREKLNLLSETVYVLQGMQYPDWETPEDALEYDAVQLLLQSANRVKPDWEVTQDNLDYVAHVCRLTQGMPLGILLATSWLDVYSLERICDEIQKSADILETEMRDVPERQRSIRAVFEYSWERLKPKEQTVLMKMSVFRGGGTPQAVEAITGANARILQSLVNKALLLRNREGRYDVHELLRQYAEAELEQSGEMDSTRDAHMNYYANRLKQQEAHLRNHLQIETVLSIEADFYNAREAWLWSLYQQDDATLEKMTFPIEMFGELTSRQFETQDLFHITYDTLLERNAPANDILLAKLKACIANTYLYTGEILQAEQLFEDSLEILKDTDDVVEILQVKGQLARAKADLEKYDEWHKQGLSGLNLAEREHCDWGAGIHHWQLSAYYMRVNNYEISLHHVKQSLVIAEKIGNPDAIGWSNYLLIDCYVFQNDLDKALYHAKKAYTVFRLGKDKFSLSFPLRTIAEIHFIRGELQQWELYVREGLTLTTYTNLPIIVYFSCLNMAHLFLIKGQFSDAARMLEKSEDARQKIIEIKSFKLNNIWISGILAALNGDYDLAYELAVQSQEISQTNLRLGSALCCIDEYDNAIPYLIKAIQEGLHYPHLPELLEIVAYFSLILAFKFNNLIKASILLGLAFQHSIQLQYLLQNPKLTELRQYLQANLDENRFKLAWEHGKSLDLETIAQELQAEFGGKEIQLPE